MPPLAIGRLVRKRSICPALPVYAGSSSVWVGKINLIGQPQGVSYTHHLSLEGTKGLLGGFQVKLNNIQDHAQVYYTKSTSLLS